MSATVVFYICVQVIGTMNVNEYGGDPATAHRTAIEEVTEFREFGAWVGGESTSGEGSERIETTDPVTDQQIAEIPAFRRSDVDTAVSVAWTAFETTWSETTPAERSRMLSNWIDELQSHAEELTLLECLDTGKPRAHARAEVQGAIETLEYYAAAARINEGKQIDAENDLHLYTRQEPYGVVGQIVPWNFPIWAAAWKLGPALAAGNCTVLKPSANTPLTTIRMAQLTADILPDGVVNVVTGSGSRVGGHLTEHDDVRKISFTGSEAVGKQVMESAADHFAAVTLELGGKSPFVVFPDADMDKVVDAVAEGVFYSTGEICDALSRAIVHEDIIDEFTDRFVEKAESHVLGDPLKDETTMGPLTTAAQLETVQEYIQTGLDEGATLLTGGNIPTDPELQDGWYIEPTVFGDVTNDMRIAQEEIFGPVQTIQSFSTYEEAIKLANDTKFGLAAGIGTEKTSLAHNAAADIDAGLIYVNDYGPILPDAPYGGFKNSGIGRDLGEEALDHYRQTKSVYVNLDEPSL
ncbi:aldehyde dehydrogenase family protein [Haloarcula sp. S1AR25-5A]|uniref:Aldehyde dehydrogenase family protein n=2 Tax=Haloarcula terrestris TaxID=2950533 RepID=A0AAE4EYF5_9EURY|nr:aldehyde dehydrogenase family protein [Haloarcula terrestris]MDS0222413.1 aldehyde dehydrogenase family protein [Haloarcula terrestris]